ncbi:PBSX family phage terminase large subunit [Clostridium thermopalmarium]|uniref:Phage terminase large subunit n=1 Tax=Clostridium thermopalmarium DSM 5974 TaxID=1121340 RepID=A0A2T0APG7_9CLOT|nr:PBSX family phage terminase large subunit [Clostridium thermopalmarium]PRR70906.1 Phage terminase large subunit [Clostridium thermopalmarium DSM 5974]PVZ28830.1 PBSX family phage terminase large subunit [Clostridium thermopalmarium DSM 5974]
MTYKLSEIIIPKFHSFHKAYKEDYLHYVLKGGRNSAKSSTYSEELILDLMKYKINALVVRRVANTLRTSVYEQLLWAIDILNVGHLWKKNKSLLELEYLPWKNKILFRGADDPQKIKSIKTSKYPIARLWFEEVAEFKTEEEVQTIVDSIVRAELPDGLKYKIVYSYNPPKRKQHWLNKKYETQFIPANTYVHHSCYLDNPYVSKAFIEEAENMKKKNVFKYRWNYLGEPIGSGVVPFDNLEFRTITDEEVKSFDNIRQGIDWGYGVDPVAFVRWHYDKTRRKLYALDEVYGVKMSNRILADKIKARKYNGFLTIADSAEPKSVAELKSYGIRIKSAKKGAGSVEYGEKWLGDLEAIVIDPKRTPNIAKEFENIDYDVDKDGNPLTRLVDKDNHTIDATRYACEDDMSNSGVQVFK